MICFLSPPAAAAMCPKHNNFVEKTRSIWGKCSGVQIDREAKILPYVNSFGDDIQNERQSPSILLFIQRRNRQENRLVQTRVLPRKNFALDFFGPRFFWHKETVLESMIERRCVYFLDKFSTPRRNKNIHFQPGKGRVFFSSRRIFLLC